jgi:hypothetical protein
MIAPALVKRAKRQRQKDAQLDASLREMPLKQSAEAQSLGRKALKRVLRPRRAATGVGAIRRKPKQEACRISSMESRERQLVKMGCASRSV